MTGQDFTKFNLPDAPGVYFFKKKGDILYIGRATSLRDRVRSYFGNDLIHTRGSLLVDMVTQADTIDWQETGSVLEAIILETNLIKEHMPHYNTKEKDDKSFNYVVITEEQFPRVLLIRGRSLEVLKEEAANGGEGLGFEIREAFGPYPHASTLREALKIIRRIFPFRDYCTPLKGKPCFNAQLGFCPGVCAGTISEKEYAKIIHRIILFFRGKTTTLIDELTRDMNAYAKVQQFEDANRIKNTLYALSHIQDIALIKETTHWDRHMSRAGSHAHAQAHAEDGEIIYDSNHSSRINHFRIEAYDIAHMSGKNVVGVMTVITNGMIDKTEYRKFRVRGVLLADGKTAKPGKSGNDDVGNLREILTRRFARTDWERPNLIVIDGGIGQKNAAEKLQNSLRELEISQGIEASTSSIPIVSVVKDERHQPRDILGDESLKPQIEQHREAILLANNEAHRFAITYHKLLRKKAFLNTVVKRYNKKHEPHSSRRAPRRTK